MRGRGTVFQLSDVVRSKKEFGLVQRKICECDEKEHTSQSKQCWDDAACFKNAEIDVSPHVSQPNNQDPSTKLLQDCEEHSSFGRSPCLVSEFEQLWGLLSRGEIQTGFAGFKIETADGYEKFRCKQSHGP